MSIDRLTRVNQLIRQEVAESLFRVINDPGADIAAVTVTRVETSANLRNARVFVSIRGNQATQDRILNLIRNHRRDIQSSIARHIVLKYTPQISFEIDHSIEEGDHVLDVIARLEADEKSRAPDQEHHG